MYVIVTLFQNWMKHNPYSGFLSFKRGTEILTNETIEYSIIFAEGEF